jgi:rRNA maturation endonuclease Nob1
MKPKYCMNCLKKTKDCDCVVKVVDVPVYCPNCKNIVSDEANFCDVCGYKLINKIEGRI